MNWMSRRSPPPMTRNDDSSALLGHFLRSHVDTMYAGTSAAADKKQFMKGFPLRLEVFSDKPKYPMFIAILSGRKRGKQNEQRALVPGLFALSSAVFRTFFNAGMRKTTAAHHKIRHISVMHLMFLDFRTSSMVYRLLGAVACRRKQMQTRELVTFTVMQQGKNLIY